MLPRPRSRFAHPNDELWLYGRYKPRTRGPVFAPKLSDVSAQTSASRRSGERPFDSPSKAKSHISSSSAGNTPACFTLPCS
jgi:hypothetical protein